MNRADARATLRGWLQEDTADQWADADLNRYLNLAVREGQKLVLSLEPDSIKKTYLRNLTVPAAGKDAIIDYPAGTWAVIELALSSDGINYTPTGRISLKNARREEYEGSNFVPWSPTHFALFPVPTLAVTNGIRAVVVPTLTMAVDTDEIPTPPAFDTYVLKQAEYLALKKSGEPTERVLAEIAAERQEAPRFFLTSTEPSFVVPILDRYASS